MYAQEIVATDLKHADLVALGQILELQGSTRAQGRRREALNQQYFLDLVLNTSSLDVLKKQLTWLRSGSKHPLQDGGR